MTAFEEFLRLRARIGGCILGQEGLVNRLLVALLADGHLLVEGLPGLAKTSAVKALAAGLEGEFHRIQFTPDLLPADITGTDIFRPADGGFRFQPGPVFHNFVLADEINRAPAKVQSALLEAMGERQVTVGRTTYPLPDPFLVMATQNPIEQDGTYPLPEAQRDRFLLHVRVDYPAPETEAEIVRLVRRRRREGRAVADCEGPVVARSTVIEARRQVLDIHLAEALEDYIVRLVGATRRPAEYDEELGRWLTYGASPRASIALDLASRAHAWLAGRDYVSPEDIQAVARDVLRHRLLLSFEAEADGIDVERALDRLLAVVAVP